MRYFVVVFGFLVLASCGQDVVVKPKALLHLQYPEPIYRNLDFGCPFTIGFNAHANITKKENCWLNLVYPHMKATIHLTYHPVSNNLDSLLFDAQKLTFDHTIKATSIFEQPRVDSINNVYGMLYMINGNAATSTQFYVTDSARHFITGSLYFESRPNFDSILPAISYIRDDVRFIMESVEWK